MKYLKVYIIVILSIIASSIIFGSLSYINFLSENLKEILKALVIFLSSFLGGFFLGKSTTKKGFLEGLKIGGMLSITFFILGLIFYRKFRLQKLILSLIILLTAILGSIIGINKKTAKKNKSF